MGYGLMRGVPRNFAEILVVSRLFIDHAGQVHAIKGD